jgi:hypothetical protein
VRTGCKAFSHAVISKRRTHGSGQKMILKDCPTSKILLKNIIFDDISQISERRYVKN